jgi:hypothetical protein
MNYFAVACLVGHIDRYRRTFFETQQRTGHLPVIGNGLDGAPGSDLERIVCDVDGVVGDLSASDQRRRSDGHAGQFEQLTPGNQILA